MSLCESQRFATRFTRGPVTPAGPLRHAGARVLALPSEILLLALDLSSATVAAAVVPPLLDIAAMVRSPRLRRRWHVLTAMLGSVVVLMLAVAATVRQTPDVPAFATAGSYAVGAVFLMGLVRLSRSTAREALRVDALEEAVSTDPLTGLGNRRRFDERLAEEVRRSRAADVPLTLIVLDLDHFKRVNDVHGHPVGDLVLKQVAASVAVRSRPSDTVCRIGGEEFVILTSGLDEAFAAATAERLRRAIGETVTSFDGGDARVTASVGLASLRPGETADMLFRRADAALYGAKRGGRDRLHLAA